MIEQTEGSLSVLEMKLFNERETLERERGLPGTCVYMLLLTHVVQAIALEGQILYIVCGMCMFVCGICMCTCVYVCVCMCVWVWFEGDNIHITKQLSRLQLSKRLLRTQLNTPMERVPRWVKFVLFFFAGGVMATVSHTQCTIHPTLFCAYLSICVEG